MDGDQGDDDENRIGLVATEIRVTVKGQLGGSVAVDDVFSVKTLGHDDVTDMHHLGWILGMRVCHEAKKVVGSIGFRERETLKGLIDAVRSWADEEEEEFSE